MIIIFFVIGYYLGNKEYINSKMKFNNNKLIKQIILHNLLSNFISYSQFLEDLILFCFLNDVKKGFYIDIGANDPNYISVTKAFYLRGWNGINIEPLPEKYQSLLKNRKRDINLKIGVGAKRRETTLYANGAGSTTSKINSRNQARKLNITIDTMENICRKYVPKNIEIQFCKIDIEGDEKNALLGYDFKNYRPKIFLIESADPILNRPNYDSWEYILLGNDYSFIYQYKINRFYIDNRAKDLEQKLVYVEKYISNYEKFKKHTKKGIS